MKNYVKFILVTIVLLLSNASGIATNNDTLDYHPYNENYCIESNNENASNNLVYNNVSIEIISHYNTKVNVFAYSEDNAYLAHENTLSIVNLSNPQNPVLEMEYKANDLIRGIEVVGNHIYLLGNDNTISILNSNRSNKLTYEGSYSSHYFISSFDVKENTLYTTEERYLKLIDVSDKNEPHLIDKYKVVYKVVGSEKTYEITDDIYNLEVDNGLAYLSIVDCMFMINVNNPDNIQFEGKYVASDSITDISIQENLAYLSCMDSGIEIIDINITNKITRKPSHIDDYNIPRPKFSRAVSATQNNNMYISNIDVKNNFAYVIADYCYFVMLNVTNSWDIYQEESFSVVQWTDSGIAEPAYEGFSDRTYLLDFEVKNETIYLTDSSNGLIVLHMKDRLNKTEVSNDVNTTAIGFLNEISKEEKNNTEQINLDKEEFHNSTSVKNSEKSTTPQTPGFKVLELLSLIEPVSKL